ncbi:MAG: hypothetical protein ACREX8_21540, partial [Gammaproteobacteria bacterium]
FAGQRPRVRVNGRGRFMLTLRAAPGLRGRTMLRSTRKVRVSPSSSRRLTLARTTFKVAPPGRVTLSLRLSRRNLRTLRHNGKINTTLTITLTDATSLTATARKRITLMAPRQR